MALFPLQASEKHLEEHYCDLKGRDFFPHLIKYMSSGPVVAMVRVLQNHIVLSENDQRARRSLLNKILKGLGFK